MRTGFPPVKHPPSENWACICSVLTAEAVATGEVNNSFHFALFGTSPMLWEQDAHIVRLISIRPRSGNTGIAKSFLATWCMHARLGDVDIYLQSNARQCAHVLT